VSGGRSVWVTGASQGIGRALALGLAARGDRVAISARGADALAELAQAHPGLRPEPLDVTDAAATASAIARIEAAQGPIDLAVLNAGVYRPLPGGLAAPEVFAEHMAVNYQGVVNGLCAILPGMRERRRGQIALVASVAGYRGLPQAAAYGPTKAALINLAETLRLELRGTGVDLRLVNPGFVATRLTAQNRFAMPALLTPEQAARAILGGLDGRRFEIAFPWAFVAWMRLLRHLPYALYFPLVARLTGLDRPDPDRPPPDPETP
jgi:NAD(P)-dependent dehydrogenase (short-subunit alcohol dehydrogenase family)